MLEWDQPLSMEQRIQNLEVALYQSFFAIGYLLEYSMQRVETEEERQQLKDRVLNRFPPALHEEIVNLLSE